MIPAMVPAGLERRSLVAPHSLLTSRQSSFGPASPARRRSAGEITLRRDSRAWPRPQPPQPPPRARSMTLRPPRPPPAPSWLQHHLRDRGRGEESGGRSELEVGGTCGSSGNLQPCLLRTPTRSSAALS
uniref:Uncharacterized protein n=1 Tax=Mus musculus TaxID=10090 RepID=Q8C2V3_MOUSE|nr:unnamed protein product [Mus musculus]